jgi:predicted DsbA family dithiol-disulfide isomerase
VHFAAAHGLQDAMKERLFRAYLTEGELVSDPATLERLGVEAGLPADEVREVVRTDQHGEAVREDERAGAALGVRGVPFFVVDRAVAASGAQPAEVLRGMLDQAWAAAHPQVPTVVGGEACGPDGC